MNQFNPFKTTIENLVTDDLIALRSVNEGWHVEYKQTLSNAQAIAKSVSAMANSYGGWIFYGIKEESKENSVAGEFVGIHESDVDSSLQTIRQSVANLINPSCHYEVKALYGPCEAISLGNSKAIICIAVPQSIESPHIHNKGVIYRRISDGSEPVPESDRFMIEKMFDRSSKIVKDFKKWIKQDPELSKGEANVPFLRVILVPNLWNMPRPGAELNVDVVKKILNEKDGRKNHMPYDTVYSSASAIIARQCNADNPIRASLTWKIYNDLASDILIPLSWIEGDLIYIYQNLAKFDHKAEFVSLLKGTNVTHAKIVNLNYVFNVLMSIIESQRAFQEMFGWPLSFNIKIKLLNVWRTIPFLDVDYFINHIRDNGIPVVLTKKSLSPNGYHPETFRYISHEHQGLPTYASVTLQTMGCFIPIAEAFGLPFAHLIKRGYGVADPNGDPENFFAKLTAAGIRATQ
jgi:hypothetical protein